MANYYATARSNCFRVKDRDAFLADMETMPNIEVIEKDNGSFCILADDPDGAGWPGFAYDEETGEDYEVDISGTVAKHLADNEVAIFMEAGAEKLRYVIGHAVAVNNKGEYRIINLSDIYDIAKKELTENPEAVTVAEY
jgi:hypothetical protein